MGRESYKVGLLSHVWGGNLGDDGSLDAVIQNIRKRWPDAEIFGLSMSPEDTRKRHGIPSYPIRVRQWSLTPRPAAGDVSHREHFKELIRQYRCLFKALKAVHSVLIRMPRRIFREMLLLAGSARVIRSLDLLVISGGGQLIESSGGPWQFVGGPFQFPFTVFKWLLVAKAFGAKCVVLNVGAGPLFRTLTKFFVRGGLALADYVSFRDEESRALVERLGFRGESHVFPDNAYSLDIAPHEPGKRRVEGGAVVGIAPMAYGDRRLSSAHDPGIYDDFIRQLGTYGSWLLRNRYQVTLFCTDIGVDPPVIEDVQRLLQSDRVAMRGVDACAIHRVHQWTTQELLSNMASMDYVIVCRYHAVVFAHLLNIPVLAIAHHPKVRALMSDLGLSEFCVDVCNSDESEFAEKFASLVRNRDRVKRRMAEKSTCYRQQLVVQFDELFPPPVKRDEFKDSSRVPRLLPVSK